MSQAPLFSVIIPTCQRPQLLARCLERLAPGKQSLPGENYEVIVTDDGTTDETTKVIAGFPWARWTQGPRRGPAANRNHGATRAEGEWLVFTDDDCLPDVNWLEAFAGRARQSSDAPSVLEGRTYVDRARRHPLEVSPVNGSGGVLWSCNFAIKRSAFVMLGGFDERFPYSAMEDCELRIRLVQRNTEMEFVPQAGVMHPWRRIENWERHASRHMESRLILESIHPGAGFPVPWHRALRTNIRVCLIEHFPWLVRHPGESLRVLPRIWRTMALEIWITWHRRRN